MQWTTERGRGLAAEGQATRATRHTWLATPIAHPTTEGALAQARHARQWADAVEFRLDLMASFDLSRLLAETPLPTIVTCRPLREGGRFCLPEAERLAILREAASQGATLIDIEWDAVDQLGDVGAAQRIVSRHVFDHTPRDLWALYRDLAAREGDVVKIATYAHTLEDALRMLALLARADRPTIAIAMGEAGLISRLLAPAFPAAFLTFGAVDDAHKVAPGQVTLQEMWQRYHVHRLRPGVSVYGLLDPHANHSPIIAEINQRWAEEGEDAILVPLQITAQDDLPRIRALCHTLGIQPMTQDDLI